MLRFPPDLQAAVDAVKRDMGVTTAPADEIAKRLPPHLRRPFWAAAVDQYLDERIAEMGEVLTVQATVTVAEPAP
jgi:hypothetical protein